MFRGMFRGMLRGMLRGMFQNMREPGIVEFIKMFGITRAPDFTSNSLQWLNVERPLTLNDLSGRLVILDFWTYCCINCIHILPILRRIEEAFPQEVAVIGVHSPKFAAERDPDHVRHAIARYDIRHPVVHDPDFQLWQDYAIRAWPTLVLISPKGQVIGQLSGEPDPDLFLQGITQMVRDFSRRGEIAARELPAMHSPTIAPAETRLRFPGKIKPVPGDIKRWAIADSGHHQIVLLSDDGAELARYGNGRPGLMDGAPDRASFTSPQGLDATAEAIFVADTGNHAIRRIDLADGAVTTLAGTGRRGPPLTPKPAAGWEIALASPWDVAVVDGGLYVANAGSHQIGRLDFADGKVRNVAGTGGEDIVDGPAVEAILAQPSGLALSPDGQELYFADSETSAVRRLSLNGRAMVETLVGRGLFEFGHHNGAFGQARLQHPLGVAAGDGAVFVADSYNGALRRLDLTDRSVQDLGGDFACIDKICLPAGEPAGLSLDGHRILVSDTNNHRVLEYDLAARHVRTWAE